MEKYFIECITHYKIHLIMFLMKMGKREREKKKGKGMNLLRGVKALHGVSTGPLSKLLQSHCLHESNSR